MESGTKTNLVEVIDPECISRRANRSSRLTFLTFLIKVSAMVAIQNMHWRTRQILPSLPPPSAYYSDPMNPISLINYQSKVDFRSGF